MEHLTPRQRHDNMAAVHSSGTKPELIVRKFLFSHGFRYRLNYARLPGHPDIVLRKYRTCIFVNGCFWHGHENCKYYVTPKTNTAFWVAKIERNKARDIRTRKELADMGWRCITLWECELKPPKREHTLAVLEYALNDFYLQDHRAKTYVLPPEGSNPSKAAEPSSIDDYGKE